MGFTYKASDKQSLKDRNELFNEVGVSSLEKKGFERAPFKTSWNGEFDKSIKGYSYQLARIRESKFLEIIYVYILEGEPWIQIYLNVFELTPTISRVSLLKDMEGLSFGIPQNSITKMRLRSDDYKGPPIFYMMFLPEHKIGRYFTKLGYEAELTELKKLLKSDMENIDDFVNRWHELHKPNVTDWEGNIISKTTL
ncbi:MAG: hypothetical protein WAT92_05710 [Saprospiraceae bacterium]|nr:hypothetical protein [Saprospiraceae bacterium]HMS68330.1 hypothetical protein [Saprospiraceae bacterium]